MTAVSILTQTGESGELEFRALSAGVQTTGRTAGEALDSLTKRLDSALRGTVVVIQSFDPDEHFSREQRERLRSLTQRLTDAKCGGTPLEVSEQAELERLVELEQLAALQRSRRLSEAVGK